MKSLYESILSDIDTNLDNGNDEVINVLLNDQVKSPLWYIFDLSRHDVGRRYPLKFENKTIYIYRDH